MLNKKGFTLVEVLSVIVLIALLFGIGIPGIMKISDNMKVRSYNTKVDLLEQAGELWGQDNKSLLQTGKCDIDSDGNDDYSCYKVPIKDLINEDYLESENKKEPEYKNPKDDTSMLEKCVYVYKKNNRVYAKYVGKDEPCDNDIITSINGGSVPEETPPVLTGEAILKNKPFSNFSSKYSSIVSVSFVGHIDYSNAIDLGLASGNNYYIVSASSSPNTVYAWLETNEDDPTKYDAYIGSEAYIYLPSDSNDFFDGLKNVTEIIYNNFNTSRVENMKSFFSGLKSMKQLDLSSYDTSKVTNMSKLFGNCSSLEIVDLSPLETSKVTNMDDFFSYTSNIKEIDMGVLDTSSVENMDYMFFASGVNKVKFGPSFNSEKVKTADQMFTSCNNLIEVDMEGFDTDNITDFSYMFDGCQNLKRIKNINFNTEKLKYTYGMFYSCKSLEEIDLSSFNFSQVTNVHSMFLGCSSLEEIDLSNFDAPNLTNASSMFSMCSSLKKVNLSNFDAPNLSDVDAMFSNCSLLEEIDLSSFKAESVNVANYVFYSCNALKKVYISSEVGSIFNGKIPYRANVIYK